MVQRLDVDAAHIAVDPIIGGNPADRCKSEALFLTLNASNWVMSTESPLV